MSDGLKKPYRQLMNTVILVQRLQQEGTQVHDRAPL